VDAAALCPAIAPLIIAVHIILFAMKGCVYTCLNLHSYGQLLPVFSKFSKIVGKLFLDIFIVNNVPLVNPSFWVHPFAPFWVPTPHVIEIP
jgi:hypothetical protein